MNRDEYQELKQSGGLVDDAGLQTEEARAIEIIEEAPEEKQIEEPVEDIQEEPLDEPTEDEIETTPMTSEDDEEIPELSEKEKTAFEKRLERERKKLEEKLKQELEQQYGKHKKVLESLGGDPDAILQRIEENKMIAEANRLAEVNGWTDDEYQRHIQAKRFEMDQQRRDKELQELRVQVQINKLKGDPNYAGIDSMEREIVDKINRTNGALSVDEAYWALGGAKRAEQIKLEAQMREIEKRKKQPRTVITDTQTPSASEKPLPSDVLRDAERMGISASEARRLMSSEPPQSIDEFRKRKAK